LEDYNIILLIINTYWYIFQEGVIILWGKWIWIYYWRTNKQTVNVDGLFYITL